MFAAFVARLAAWWIILLIAGVVACTSAAPSPAAPTPAVPVERNAMGRPDAPVVVEEWADFF